MWTQIRLLLVEQSDLAPHCLSKGLLKYFSRQFAVIGLNISFNLETVKSVVPEKKKQRVFTIYGHPRLFGQVAWTN